MSATPITFDPATFSCNRSPRDSEPRFSGGFSPLNLDSDSLGDRLQEKVAGSKVIGVALKDRAAILMAGRKATAAYWFDPKMPGFTSSSYYHANRTMLNAFNASVPQS